MRGTRTMTEQREKMYEGKAKIIYATDQPGVVIQHFKDDATAFNAAKRGTIQNKGVINNHIASILYQLMEKSGIATHYLERLTDRDMLVRHCQMFPLEVVMRNRIAGSLAKRMGTDEGGALPFPILEYYLKDDALGDPFINVEHIRAFDLVNDAELAHIDVAARRVNTFLTEYFAGIGISLVDCKFEFGSWIDAHGTRQIVLADEVTPDTCRLWDAQTGEKLDKDRFRRDLGKVAESYQRVYRLVCASVS